MKNSRDGLVLMALGAIVFLAGAAVGYTSAFHWIGGATFIAGFVTWQWHARRDLRERQED